MTDAPRPPIDLGAGYRIERELGGGGMSRVFLAEEVALGRRVAVKVLPPELSERVSRERFRREVQLAASLQHPHIVPLLAAGESDGMLFYTMPMVDGQSLRGRLSRGDPLSASDMVRILRDIAEALEYAHARGVVHRDIKPDNVLLAGGTRAMVVDFGVAKAISSARHDGRLEIGDGQRGNGSEAELTTAGIALGTPSYMAPEQAAADPDADHRVDLYAVGAIGYEMLSGQPLFAGLSPAAVLASQVSKPPEPLPSRADVPDALYDVIDTCLAKNPADRFADARALVSALELVQSELANATPQNGALRGARRSGDGPAASARRGWRRVAVAAVVLLVVLGVVANRKGVWPFEQRTADGRMLQERDPVLVAQFADGGSGLGAVVSDALRTDLSQSWLVRVVQPAVMRESLERMQRDPISVVDSSLASEIAVREGIPAIITGDVQSVGRGFQLTARLIRPDSGLVLVAVRESAVDSSALIGAIDRLSKQLRGRLGESLRDLAATPPLERVTTGSLDALRRYTTAVDLIDAAGDYPRGIRLLEEAIALDSTFAMALRKLSVAMGNRGDDPLRSRALLEQALRHRDRLTPLEAHLLDGGWYSSLGPQRNVDRAMSAYVAVLDIDPKDTRALNNLAILHLERGDFAAAETLLVHAVSEVASALQFNNLVDAQLRLGKVEAADSSVQQFRERFPKHPLLYTSAAAVAYSRGDFKGVDSLILALRAAAPGDDATQRVANITTASLAVLRGQTRAATAAAEQLLTGDRGRDPIMRMTVNVRLALAQALLSGDAQAARQRLDLAEAAMREGVPAPFEGLVRLQLARVNALAGRTTQAQALLAEYRRMEVTPDDESRTAMAFTEAELASQGGDHARALEIALGAAQFTKCPDCLDAELARLHDRAGHVDSAISLYTAYVGTLQWWRLEEDAFTYASAVRRLGELHEQEGNRDAAAQYYVQYLDLYAQADPELQDQINEVRRRLARLKPA